MNKFDFYSKINLIIAITLILNLLLFYKVAGILTILATLFIWALLGLPGIIYTTRLRSFNIISIAVGVILGIAVSLLLIAVIGSIFDYFGPVLFLFVPTVLSIISLYFVKKRNWNDFLNFKITNKDLIGISISQSVALLLIALPLMSVGALIDGAYQYSPFFCADFFKHMAISQALNIGHMPPVNPFAFGEGINYYWFYYIIPASILNLLGPSVRADGVLLACNIIQTNLFIILLFAACRKFGAKALGTTIAVVIGMLSLSLDGYATRILNLDVPINLRTQNINMESLDITQVFGISYHISASTLFRLCLYLPHHLLAVKLFLTWILLRSGHKGSDFVKKTYLLVIVILLPSISLLYGAVALLSILLIEFYFKIKKEHSYLTISMIGMITAAVLVLLLGIFDLDYSSGLISNSVSTATNPSFFNRLLFLPLQLISSFGCILIAGVTGCIMVIRSNKNFSSSSLTVPLLIGTGLIVYVATEAILGAGHLRINFQLKTSFFILPALVVGTSLFLTYIKKLKRISFLIIGTLCGILALLGVPSTLHDIKWHSVLLWDWDKPMARTVSIPESEMEALDWIRLNTPPASIFAQQIQPSYISGGIDAWIPIFGGRQVLISGRGSGTGTSSIENNSRLFEANDANIVFKLCKDANIDYIYNSKTQNSLSYDKFERILAQNPDIFLKEFSVDGVSVWKVMQLDE